MPKNIYKDIAIVTVDELTPEMHINAYLDLQVRYANLNEKSVAFFQKNFHGATLNISRNRQVKNILSNELAVGDTVFEIYNFPKALKKLTSVSGPLVKLLSARGFQKFKVHRLIDLPSGFSGTLKGIIDSLHTDQPQRESSGAIQLTPSHPAKKSVSSIKEQPIRETKKLVSRLVDSDSHRKDASESIEQFMDNAREGKIEKKSIESYVNSLTEGSSSVAMMALASLKKSDQTYAHCVDVAAIFTHGYSEIRQSRNLPSAFKGEKEMMLGAFLHDFGKSEIPKYIIDSTTRFKTESREFQIIQHHPVLGAKILVKEMDAPKHIVNMALYHHVKPDSNMINSYPGKLDYKNATYETRLLAIIDTYQALIGRRRYKRSWTPVAAIRYLDALSGLEYDLDVWNDFKMIMGTYPIGTLLQLNDGSLAFVTAFSKSNPLRPSVVIVENAAGERLTHHSVIDLVSEQDVQIVKDIDHYEIFGNQGFDIFTSINLV